eukprot:gene2173-3087_t
MEASLEEGTGHALAIVPVQVLPFTTNRDRQRRVDLNSMLRLFSHSCHVAGLQNPGGWFDMTPLRTERSSVFAIAQTLRLKDDAMALRGQSLAGSSAGHVHCRIGSVGNTSWSILHELFAPNGGPPIATLWTAVVHVVDRKPAPLPPGLRGQMLAACSSYLTPPGPLPGAECLPPDEYSYQVTVRPSDTDHNMHVNQAVYIVYVCDAVE